MQRACGQRDVINIAGLTRDMQAGGVMGMGRPNRHYTPSLIERTEVARPERSA